MWCLCWRRGGFEDVVVLEDVVLTDLSWSSAWWVTMQARNAHLHLLTNRTELEGMLRECVDQVRARAHARAPWKRNVDLTRCLGCAAVTFGTSIELLKQRGDVEYPARQHQDFLTLERAFRSRRREG